MNGIPDVEEPEDDSKSQGSDDDELKSSDSSDFKRARILCTPYIQIFKNGKRIFQSIKKK